MKSLKVVLLFVASLGLLAYGCAKSDDSDGGSSSSPSAYERKNLPAKTANNLPSSLTKGSSSSRTAQAMSLTQSIGVNQVRTAVDMSKNIMQSVEMNMVIFDAGLTQGAMSIGNCYEKGEIKITFTSAMLEAMKQSMAVVDQEMSASDLEQFGAMVGQQMGNDDFAISYSTASETGYDKKLILGSTNSTCSSGVPSSKDEVMMWSDNGNKLKYTFDFGEASYSMTNFGTVAYDAESKTGSFDMYFASSGFDGLYSGSFTECNSGTDECVNFRINSANTFSGTTYRLDSRGKADNNGGYAVSRYMDGSFNAWLKEQWDTTDANYVYGAFDCNSTWDNYTNCTFSDQMSNFGGSGSSDDSSVSSYSSGLGQVFGLTTMDATPSGSNFTSDASAQKYVIVASAGSVEPEKIIGTAAKIDNSTVGYTLYFKPSNNDNYTMYKVSASSYKRSVDNSSTGRNLAFTTN